MLDSPVSSIVAAACALAAGAWSLAVLQRARRAEEREVAALAEASVLRQLEMSAPSRPRSIVDPETGLPDGRFFEIALAHRVAAARRHLWPVTVVLIDVSHQGDDLHRSDTLAALAVLIDQTLRETDTVCRTGPTTFALVLDDTNEAGGVWAAERLQFASARDSLRTRRLAAGVASYPAHGLESEEVLQRARSALARACSADPDGGLGRVEVARADVTWDAN